MEGATIGDIAVLEKEEEGTNALIHLDSMQGPPRWRIMAHCLGDFNVHATKCAMTWEFRSSAHMMDTIALSGCRMIPCGGGMGKISIMRHRNQWPLLTFLLILLERHNVRMTMFKHRAEEYLCYQSMDESFMLGEQWARWYCDTNEAKAVIPLDVWIDENALALWIFRGMIDHPGLIVLEKPFLSLEMGNRLIPFIRDKVDVYCELQPMSGVRNKRGRNKPRGAIVFDQKERCKVERWVAKRLPRCLWGQKR